MDKTVVRLVCVAIVATLALAGTSMDQGSRIVISSIVGLSSFVLMIISRRQLGKSFSIMPQARALITTGLYSRIQHPMYIFLDLFLVALIVALNCPIVLFAWGIFVVTQTLQSQREERVLAASFGDDYAAYRSRTWI